MDTSGIQQRVEVTACFGSTRVRRKPGRASQQRKFASGLVSDVDTVCLYRASHRCADGSPVSASRWAVATDRRAALIAAWVRPRVMKRTA